MNSKHPKVIAIAFFVIWIQPDLHIPLKKQWISMAR
jgi:hypothetical protein